MPRVNIDNMEGHDFEYWCADLLRNNGFTNVSVTSGSGDQGVDVLATKDGERYAVQCKRYSSKLGNTPVQEVYTGKAIYNCQVAAVMTNNYFTSGAIEAARATGVLLWDRDVIERMNRKRQSEPKPIRNNDRTDSNRIQSERNPAEIKDNHGRAVVLVVAFLIMAIAVALNFNVSDNKKSNKETEETRKVADKTLWAAEFTPIDKFQYTKDGRKICIRKCIDSSKNIWIAPSYEIMDTPYSVEKIDDLDLNPQVESIIISEGITDINNAIFYKADNLKRIYFPSTISNLLENDKYAFYTYLTADEVTIYFGGTKESLEKVLWNIEEYENITVYYECCVIDGNISVGKQ